MTYSVRDLEERFGVGEHTILNWIRTGELKAINVGRVAGKRPKWRFTQEAIAAFELARESGPAPAPAKRRKKGEALKFF